MKGLIIAIAAWLLIFGFVGAEVSGAQGDAQQVIGSIRVAGNRSVTTAEILSRVRSREGQVFDAATAAQDTKRIAELPGVEYSYYNKEVVDGRVQLTFVVVERNLVRSITFVGNRRIKQSKLSDQLDFKLGDYLDPILAEAGRKAVVDYYRERGYTFASVTLDTEQLSYGKVIYTITEGPRVRISSVEFVGNSAITTRGLRKVVKTWPRKFYVLRQYFTQDKLEADVAKLQNVYYKRGFLDAKVNAYTRFSDDNSSVRVTFAISEGSAYKIRNITIRGNTFFEGAQLAKLLKSKRGQTYSKDRADGDVKRLLKSYRETGFINARVERNVKFVSAAEVDVEFDIQEGERFKIGRIDITGNQQTQDRVVRNVLTEYEFVPGRWYNADMARGDGTGYLERLVQASAVAQQATITPTGEEPGVKDAQVNIIEGRTGMVMLGAGVSTDSGVIGQLVFNQRNFDIHDWPDSFRDFVMGKGFKGAGQSLRIALEPGTEVSQYSVSFTEPYFKNKPISLDVSGSSWRRFRESFDEERLRAYVGFEQRLKGRWRRSISLRGENVDVADVDSDAPSEVTDVKGDNLLFGVRLGFGRDMTDDKWNPSAGYSFNVGFEPVFGDHTFSVVSGTHRKYWTVHEDLAERKTILATKLHAAAILGDAPLFEKFYAGGQGSLRGFDYRGVSPRSGPDDDPVGSDWIFLANAELIQPIYTKNFALLFFVDSGMVETGGYRASIGTGIQIMLPQYFGPVPMRFEIATPFLKSGDDETQVFSFSVGRLF